MISESRQLEMTYNPAVFVKPNNNVILYKNIKYWNETSIYTNITNNKYLNSDSQSEPEDMKLYFGQKKRGTNGERHSFKNVFKS